MSYKRIDFNIAQKELLYFTNRLDTFGKYDTVIATRNTLNTMVFQARRAIIKGFKSDLTIRPGAKKFIDSHVLADKVDYKERFIKNCRARIFLARKSPSGNRLATIEFGLSQNQRQWIGLEAARYGNSLKRRIRDENLVENFVRDIPETPAYSQWNIRTFNGRSFMRRGDWVYELKRLKAKKHKLLTTRWNFKGKIKQVYSETMNITYRKQKGVIYKFIPFYKFQMTVQEPKLGWFYPVARTIVNKGINDAFKREFDKRLAKKMK